jgi:hypothetical protein
MTDLKDTVDWLCDEHGRMFRLLDFCLLEARVAELTAQIQHERQWLVGALDSNHELLGYMQQQSREIRRLLDKDLARTQGKPEPPTRQPIATAPRDRTPVWLLRSGYDPVLGLYDSENQPFVWRVLHPAAGWCEDSAEHPGIGPHSWAPIGPPPKENK